MYNEGMDDESGTEEEEVDERDGGGQLIKERAGGWEKEREKSTKENRMKGK